MLTEYTGMTGIVGIIVRWVVYPKIPTTIYDHQTLITNKGLWDFRENGSFES